MIAWLKSLIKFILANHPAIFGISVFGAVLLVWPVAWPVVAVPLRIILGVFLGLCIFGYTRLPGFPILRKYVKW